MIRELELQRKSPRTVEAYVTAAAPDSGRVDAKDPGPGREPLSVLRRSAGAGRVADWPSAPFACASGLYGIAWHRELRGRELSGLRFARQEFVSRRVFTDIGVVQHLAQRLAVGVGDRGRPAEDELGAVQPVVRHVGHFQAVDCAFGLR
jgi:hypothetical protein